MKTPKTTASARATAARPKTARPKVAATKTAARPKAARPKTTASSRLPSPPSAPPNPAALLAELERAASPRYRADMAARYGIVTAAPVLGVPVGVLRALAKRLGTDHALADALWKTGVHDARMLATMVADPARVTPAQMDRWTRAMDNWALVDAACFSLFDRTPHVFGRVEAWAGDAREMVKRAAFALLASAALHGHGTDAEHLRGLQLVEREASDPRNFVKKGVSWALRAIGGKKSPKLRAAARASAARLATSSDATARWIGKDALRAFAKAMA